MIFIEIARINKRTKVFYRLLYIQWAYIKSVYHNQKFNFNLVHILDHAFQSIDHFSILLSDLALYNASCQLMYSSITIRKKLFLRIRKLKQYTSSICTFYILRKDIIYKQLIFISLFTVSYNVILQKT